MQQDGRYLQVLESLVEWNGYGLQNDYDYLCYPKIKDLPKAYEDRVDELDDLVRGAVDSLEKLSEFVQDEIETEKKIRKETLDKAVGRVCQMLTKKFAEPQFAYLNEDKTGNNQ